MKASKKRQGELLVEMGALSPYNLSRALVLQMEAKLLEVFTWREGRFAFKKGHPSRDQPVRLERTTAALILEGIRRSYDAERMHTVLAPFGGLYLAPSPDRRQRLQDITSDPNEQRFVDSLDGSVKFEAALATTMIPTDRARLLLVAMAEAGMIVPAQQPSTRAVEEAPVQDSQPYLAATGRSSEELLAILDVMHHQTHFEVLAVDRDANQVDVDTAYEVRARDFHPDHFRSRPEAVRVVAERIFERLEEAHAVLSDATARRRYVTQLERGKPEVTEETGAAPGESPQVAAERIYFQGVAHLRARRYRDAAEAFRQATALAPAQASYRSALGWAIYRQSPADANAVSAGLAELVRAVDTDAKSPWAKVSLGRFYAETGMPDEAIHIFEEVMQTNPGLSDIEEEIRRLKGAS
jgi:curved DNA-binding protein CbpA